MQLYKISAADTFLLCLWKEFCLHHILEWDIRLDFLSNFMPFLVALMVAENNTVLVYSSLESEAVLL